MIPINAIHRFSKVEAAQCYYLDLQPFYSGAYCNGQPTLKPTVGQVIHSTVARVLISTPSCITSILTICRFIQIRSPFTHIKIRYCVACFVAFEVYVFVIECLIMTDSNSFYSKLVAVVGQVGID